MMAIAIKIKDENSTVLAQSTQDDKALMIEGCWYFKPN